MVCAVNIPVVLLVGAAVCNILGTDHCDPVLETPKASVPFGGSTILEDKGELSMPTQSTNGYS